VTGRPAPPEDGKIIGHRFGTTESTNSREMPNLDAHSRPGHAANLPDLRYSCGQRRSRGSIPLGSALIRPAVAHTTAAKPHGPASPPQPSHPRRPRVADHDRLAHTTAVVPPIFYAPARQARTTAAWLLAVAVLLGSVVCLTLSRILGREPWIFGLSIFLIIGATIGLRANLSAHRRRSGHMGLARTEPAFVIGQRRLYHVRSIAYAFASVAMVNGWPTPTGQPWSTFRVTFTLLFAVFIAGSSLELLTGLPRIELHPRSLRLLRPLIRYDVPWDAIGSTTPPKPRNWASPQITRLNIIQPDIVSSGGLGRHQPRRINLPEATICPPADVAALIDHYLTQPQDRHTIGTTEELDRLRATGLA
jgi:hypothetical protein